VKLTINDDLTRGPKVEIKEGGRDMLVTVNGVAIARRGHPDIPEAGTWVSLEPGWTVTSSEDDDRMEVRIMYDSEPAGPARLCVSALCGRQGELPVFQRPARHGNR
jgi:hypothetical protein